ncbi:epithelial membrane protein 2 [Magallana gigas]|uniref:epithelial membrane protein 2 n=1 Tax=Magallana gigas TaxID=29159 RepID=UPI00333FF429
MDAPVMLIVALVLTICALVFQIIGLASPYWISYKGFGSANAYSGLWKTCTEIQKTTCTDIADKEDWMGAVQAMSILGFLVLVVAVVMTVLKLFVMKDNKPVLFAGIGTSFAGGIFILIAVAVYAAKTNDRFDKLNIEFDFHFAFAFSIIAMITAFAAGGVMIFGMMKE